MRIEPRNPVQLLLLHQFRNPTRERQVPRVIPTIWQLGLSAASLVGLLVGGIGSGWWQRNTEHSAFASPLQVELQSLPI
jgi:hypothetical protein